MVHGQGIYLVFYLTMLGISAICLVISHSVHGQEHYHLMLDQVLYRPITNLGPSLRIGERRLEL